MKFYLVTALSLTGALASAEVIKCQNVSVNYGLNSNLFEEGVGSIYDIDDEGYAGADSDSIGSRIEVTRSGVELRVGQMSLDADRGYTTKKESDSDTKAEYTAKRENGETFRYLYLKNLKILKIYYTQGALTQEEIDEGQEHEDGEQEYVTADCRNVPPINYQE